MNKEKTVAVIASRIRAEYKKHGQHGLENWAMIAALKIYTELKGNV